jgi:hypothetical protein
MTDTRDDLRALGDRLLALHGALLKYERADYEATHGPTKPGELLRLLLNDAHFAWLRPLSGMVAQIDEALDPRQPAPDADVPRLFRAAQQLLRSGDEGVFQTRYRDVLQASPEIVMAHAEVVKLLRP